MDYYKEDVRLFWHLFTFSFTYTLVRKYSNLENKKFQRQGNGGFRNEVWSN